MTPSHELETIRCLLCQGVICFTADDDARYKDHLHVEHRVFYYVSWIIQKTLEENSKEKDSALSFPSVTITPLCWKGAQLSSRSDAQNHVPVPNGMDTFQPFKSQLLVGDHGIGDDEEEEEEEPSISVIPVLPSYFAHTGDNNTELDEEDEERAESDPASGTAGGLQEAKILTVRVKGNKMGGRKMYRCSLCPNLKPWPTYHKAERHRTTHIPLAYRKMFQCPQCRERFIKEKNVKRHLDSGLCQGPREHPCAVCLEVFQSKFDLQLHEESHVELLKRYRCHLCGAKFNKTKYLSKHIKSHSNYKPYKCDVCGKAFKSEYYVKTHRAAHNLEDSGLSISYRRSRNRTPDEQPEANGEVDGGGASNDGSYDEHLEPEIEMMIDGNSEEEEDEEDDRQRSSSSTGQ